MNHKVKLAVLVAALGVAYLPRPAQAQIMACNAFTFYPNGAVPLMPGSQQYVMTDLSFHPFVRAKVNTSSSYGIKTVNGNKLMYLAGEPEIDLKLTPNTKVKIEFDYESENPSPTEGVVFVVTYPDGGEVETWLPSSSSQHVVLEGRFTMINIYLGGHEHTIDNFCVTTF